MINSVPYIKRQDPTFRADPVSPQRTKGKNPLCNNKFMITVLFDDCNDFSQDYYDRMTASIQLHRVECTCGKKGCLIRYGHYRRFVKFMSVLIRLSIQRVRCKECGTSNALIPSLIVPYSQIPLRDQQEILSCADGGSVPKAVMEKNFLIDENNVKHIIRQFNKHWKQRLLSIGLSILDDLAIPCLLSYSRQFMQIHRTRNKLYAPTNTT